MTWVKICGITNLEDARVAVEAGADAVGFVFYEKSPRKTDVEAARQIVAELPAGIEKVGVFVDQTMAAMELLAREIGLTGIQLHTTASWNGPGAEPRTGAAAFYRTISAAGQFMDRTGQFERAMWFHAGEDENHMDAIFLDSCGAGKLGGTGTTFDWQAAQPLVEFLRNSFQSRKLVVAGGLTAENVGEAIKILRPWGVDVASGVEARPGKKDPDKVRAFVTAVRQAEKNI